MPFTSIHVNSCQCMSFMSIHVIHVNSCNVSFDFSGISVKWRGGICQICLPRPSATASLSGRRQKCGFRFPTLPERCRLTPPTHPALSGRCPCISQPLAGNRKEARENQQQCRKIPGGDFLNIGELFFNFF
jgi:hypothetical protein